MEENKAQELLLSYKPDPYMQQHALATKLIMQALAEKLGEDINLWGLTGFLHDLDYPFTQANPNEHGLKSAELLQDHLPAEYCQAIRAHNGEMNGNLPKTRLDYALRAAETVTGLIVTAALVRPTRMEGMQVSSLKKKMKDKAFAASVRRECIKECEQIGLNLDEFLDLSITAMQQVKI